MSALFKNNATALLAASISTSGTTLVLTAGAGLKFPVLVVPDFFYGTIYDSAGNYEIVKVTARTADSLTVVRAQEGTSALAFSSGDAFAQRVTAASLNDFAQKSVDQTFTGINSFTNNVFAAAGLDGTTQIAQGYGLRARMDAANGQAIVQFTNNAANAQIGSIVADGSTLVLNPPTGGAVQAPTATVGTNSPQLATTAFVQATLPSGVIVMWSGAIGAIPSGWYLCNGSNGTPNLVDRFVVAAGSGYAVGATGGSANATLVSHTHTASVSDPGHAHNMEKYNKRAPDANSGTEVIAPSGFGSYVGTYPTVGATTGITVSNSTEGASATNANLPPYYALAYIMKA